MTTRGATPVAGASHATDADLVRLIDGEATLGAGEPVAAHVAGCAECEARLGRLRARSAALSSLLAASDPPAPPAGRLRPPVPPAARRAPRLRIAASLLVAAAGVAAAATPGVRGWLASHVTRATSRDVPGAGGGEAGAPAAGGAATAGAVVRFAPEGGELAVRLEAAQAAGSLELSAAADGRASAEVVGGEAESFLVLPNELRVRNGGASTASYRVALPPGVAVVTVRVGAAPPRRVSRAALEGGPLVVPLRPR